MRKRDVLIQFLLTQDESDSFNDHVKRSGFTRSAYLRMLIRGIIPADRPPPDYHAMMNELNAIGVSLNQIARKAHVLGVVDAVRYDEEVHKLNAAVSKIDDAVRLPRRL